MSKQIIQCNGCAGKLSVPVEADGKRFRCPTCRKILSIPGAQSVSQRTAAVATGPLAPTAQPSTTPLRADRSVKPATVRRQGPPAKSQPGAQSRELLVGLDQKIPRVRSSFGYRLALLGGAGLVALLPLIYLG